MRGRTRIVDDSFARTFVEARERGDTRAVRARLLDHPALAAMVRHQRMSGNPRASGEALLDRILAAPIEAQRASGVLDAWSGRDGELVECAEAAADYLPPEGGFAGSIFLVVGYDIGVAAPPDILLNVAHEHFGSAPSELGPYAAHEAHHVGFFAARPMPDLDRLNEPERLFGVIRYMTQLEGLAVHAAYPLRSRRGWIAMDGDYRVYSDAAEAARVTARYAQLTARVAEANRVSDEDVGAILNAMSSGERVWYRFGALVAWELERADGRRAVIESIRNPAAFEAAASDLLKRANRAPV